MVKLGTTNTTNFHRFSNVVNLCFLPIQVLPLSQLSHSFICNQAQKENACMLNVHMCISKKLAEYAGQYRGCTVKLEAEITTTLLLCYLGRRLLRKVAYI